MRLSVPHEAAPATVFSASIDTGADFTLIPLTWLVQIDASESRYAYMRGLWSEQRQITLYLVDLHLETGVLPGVVVAGIDDEGDQEIVLGRNILNQLILLLDGPHLQTDVLERHPIR